MALLCCCGGDDEKPKAKKFDKDFKGPIQKGRSCSDIICLLLFMAAIIVFILLGGLAWYHGNPGMLLYPVSSDGVICKDAKPYLQMFDFTKCAQLNPTTFSSLNSIQCPTPSVCVDKCPTNFTLRMPDTAVVICKRGVTAQVVNLTASPADIVTQTQAFKDQFLTDDCVRYTIPSAPVLNRCLPSIPVSELASITQNNAISTNPFSIGGVSLNTTDGTAVTPQLLSEAVKVFDQLNNAQDLFTKILNDMQRSWYWILAGFGIAIVLSFFFMFLIRCLIGPVIYVLMVASIGALGFGIYFTYTKWQALVGVTQAAGTASWDTESTWKNVFIGCCVAEGLLVLLCIVAISRVRIAVAVIGQASKAVWGIKSTLLFPILTSCMVVLCVAYWAMVSLFLATSKKPMYQTVNSTGHFTGVACLAAEASNGTNNCQFFGWGGDSWYHQNLTWLQVLNLALGLWTMNFSIALGEITLAGAFASWYWAWKKPGDVPLMPVLAAFGRSLRYHVGTVAFGSLIITIIQLIRIALEYIDRKMKGSQNALAKAILCCLKCCMWCLEKIMRAINRNAYVITAIYGYHFCKACCEALGLLTRNMLRTVVLSGISFFVLLLGKILVTIVMGGLSWAFFYGPISGELDKLSATISSTPNLNGTLLVNIGQIDKPSLNFYWLPIIIIVVGTYLIASAFFGVYGMSIDTIYLCFLEDLERNDGSPEKPYFAGKGLMKVMGKKNKVKKT